jgi:hypothetical protein
MLLAHREKEEPSIEEGAHSPISWPNRIYYRHRIDANNKLIISKEDDDALVD